MQVRWIRQNKGYVASFIHTHTGDEITITVAKEPMNEELWARFYDDQCYVVVKDKNGQPVTTLKEAIHYTGYWLSQEGYTPLVKENAG